MRASPIGCRRWWRGWTGQSRVLADLGMPPPGRSPAVTLAPAPWPHITQELAAHVGAALRSGRLGYSADCITRDFEEEWAAYHSARYAVAVNSGTTALTTAYHACGIGTQPGSVWRGDAADEVLVGAYGFFATASALLPLGVRPIFCDVDAEGAIDPCAAAAERTEHTRAIAVSHIAGHPAQMTALKALGLPIVEDGSHAHGARLGGTLVGRFGRAAAFSLQCGKMVSGGEGGIVLTDDPEVFRRACAFANFRRSHGSDVAMPRRLAETGLGAKLRMGPLEAAMAQYHLRNLDQLIAARHERLDRLTALLRAANLVHFVPPVTRPGATRGAFYEYPLRLRGGDARRLRRRRMLATRLLTAEGAQLRASNTRAIARLGIFTTANSRRAPRLAMANLLDAATLMLPTFTTEPVAITDQYAEAITRVDAALSAAEARAGE
jgi:perosamine synthetase